MLRTSVRSIVLGSALSLVSACVSHAATLTVTDGLRLWLRADAGVYNDAGFTLASDGNAVQQWNDQLVGDNSVAQNATQGASGNRPQFVANVINGLPVVRFDAASASVLGDYMDGASVLSGTVARTVFIVTSSTAAPAGNSMFELNRDPAFTAGSLYRITPEVGVRISNGNRIFNTPISATPQILTIMNSAGADVATLIAMLDGTALAQSGVLPLGINTGIAGYRIGADQSLAVSTDYTGDIAEILVFERELSEFELSQVGGYLELKYGLDTAFEFIPPAPEPGSLALLGLGMVALRSRKRRLTQRG